ncbi:MAG: 50S ribosomal protein L30 [Bdellovibrionaceae bacterium]|nr:50S ribosomal protein L30 [Pseudobdellovibrionaceae bacterium]MDW8190886.1 50S ribosomal protein L30 [Pseudobdellovibrionaceae bacterium]
MKSAKRRFRVTLLRGLMGKSDSQRKTLEALGLRKRLQSVVVSDTPANRGQILKVQHLVSVEVLQ